jgi:poly(A) polymerase
MESMQVPSHPLTDGARRLVQTLQAAGHTAVWAGGCVRDMLLGRDFHDVDIATDAPPDAVERLFEKTKGVGRHFGITLVRLNGIDYEVAAFRREGPYRDGRRPEYVEFCGPEEDAKRRDFTVNGIFYDPVAESILDWVGGREDLRKKRIRAIGDPAKRFAEDHLRILRGVRFAATLDFTLERQTAEAMRELAGTLTRISPERIRIELTRILTESVRPGDALRSLLDLGILEVLLPEVAAMAGQEQPPQFHPEGDVFTHTALMLNAMEERSPELAFAALLHDVGKPPTASREPGGRIRFERHAAVGAEMAREILRRLRFSNRFIETVALAVGNHMRFMDVPNMKTSTLRRMVSSETFPLELALHRLDCEQSHGKMESYDRVVRALDDWENEPRLPPRRVDGRDLMALGVPEGPAVGEWLQRAYEWQLDREPEIARDDVLAWLREQLGPAPR